MPDVEPTIGCVAVIAQPPTNSDTELWLSQNRLRYNFWRSNPKDKFDCFRKVDLPVECKGLQRILAPWLKDAHLLSEGGVLFFWTYASGTIVRLRCLEPVFKISGKMLLTAMGNLYEIDIQFLEVTRIAHPNVKFTNIVDFRLCYCMSDKDGNFYKSSPFWPLQKIEIERFLPHSFVWWGMCCYHLSFIINRKHWTAQRTYAGVSILTLISDDMTVWQWDLIEGAPVQKTKILQHIADLQIGKSIRNIRPCLIPEWP
eukprot:Platyproteum_vivax@DN7464_c2_g2_i3.p1